MRSQQKDSDTNGLVSGALPKEEWCVCVLFVNILHVCVCTWACDGGGLLNDDFYGNEIHIQRLLKRKKNKDRV